MLQLLFKIGQAWKENQQKEAVNRPLRSVPLMCLMEHLLEMFQKTQGWLAENGWQYQVWSPTSGALPVDSTKAPVSTQDLVQALSQAIPLLAAPCVVNRFHANRVFKESTDRVTAFQLEVSGRTEGCGAVWSTL